MVSIKLYDLGLVFCPKTGTMSDLSGTPCPADDSYWEAGLPFSQSQCSLSINRQENKEKLHRSEPPFHKICQEYVLCWSSRPPPSGKEMEEGLLHCPRSSLKSASSHVNTGFSHISPTSVGAASSQPSWHMKVPVHSILEHPC